MPLVGKIDIALKFSQMPNKIKDSGVDKEFLLNAEGKEVTIRVNNKLFQKLQQANEKYPSWVALVEGKMGHATDKGFVVEEASLQVFEKKPKLVDSHLDSLSK